MTEPRRVRTQAERDADGQAWRATAASRPGYATYRETAPGSPCWWARHGEQLPTRLLDPGRDLSPVARVMAGLPDPNPERVEQMREAFAESAATGKPVLLPDGSASVSYVPPRRRWWHRYTRRNP